MAGFAISGLAVWDQAARQPVARYSLTDWAKAYREFDVTDGLPAQAIESGAPRAETEA